MRHLIDAHSLIWALDDPTKLSSRDAMIKNDAEFQQTLEQLERMYHALAELRRDILPKNPRNFAVFAEGPVEQIRRLQKEIEVYSGATEAEEFGADLWLHLEGQSIH